MLRQHKVTRAWLHDDALEDIDKSWLKIKLNTAEGSYNLYQHYENDHITQGALGLANVEKHNDAN